MLLKDDNVAEDNDTAQDSIEIINNLISPNKPVLPWERCSSWQILVSHIAYIILSFRNWKKKKLIKKESLLLEVNTNISKNKILALVTATGIESTTT